jgi:hypothetical protein
VIAVHELLEAEDQQNCTKYRAIVAGCPCTRARDGSVRLAASARAPPLNDNSRSASVECKPIAQVFCPSWGVHQHCEQENVKASKLAERRG